MSSLWQIVKEYLDDAGFQPSKYIVAPSSVVHLSRRWFWTLVLLACVILLGVFCYSRILYFYSYPFTVVTSVDDRLIPLPQAILCPYHRDPIIIPTPHVYANMSDEEVVLTATIKYGLPLLDTQSRENVLYVNQTTLAFLRNIPSSSANELVSYHVTISLTAPKPELVQKLDEIGLTKDHFTFLKAPATVAMLNRLNQLGTDSRISYTPDTIYQLYHKFSLVTQLSDITCMFVSDFRTEHGPLGDPDCRKYFQPTVFFSEICLQLDKIDGKQLIFNKTERAADSHNLRYQFDGFAGTSSDKLVLYVAHNNDYLSVTGWTELNSATQIVINEVRTTTRLSQPYHDEGCTDYKTERDYSKCVTDCIFDPDFGNCSFYFGMLSDDSSDPYRLPKKEAGDLTNNDKPLCSIDDHIHHTGYQLYNSRKRRCYNSCPVRCSTSSIRFEQTDIGPILGCNGVCLSYYLGVHLSEPQIYISHVTFTEIPLYDVGALLAELGGTIGLFLGGSVFTVVHLLEFVSLRTLMPGCRRMCACRRKKVKARTRTHKPGLAPATAMPNRAELYS